MSRKVSVRKAQDNLTELFARAEQAGERFVIERNGKPLGAIVSVADLERIERMTRNEDSETAEQRLLSLRILPVAGALRR